MSVGAFATAMLLGCQTSPERIARPIEVTTVGDAGRHQLGDLVWGLDPADPMPPLAASIRPGPQDPVKTQEPAVPGEHAEVTLESQGEAGARRATLRARFGSTILIAPDGTITKQYFLSGEAGGVFLNLLLLQDPAAPLAAGKDVGPLVVGGGEGQGVLPQMLGDQKVEVFYLHDFEIPEGVPMRDPPNPKTAWSGAPPPLKPGAANSLLLVSAMPDALAAFEGALNLFFANIPQIEIEVKVVEYSTTDALAFGVSQTASGDPTLRNRSSGKLIQDIVSEFPLSSPFLGAANLSDLGIITLGGIHDTWQLNAELQLLEANNIADIVSSPKLVVRNGGVAQITTVTDFPYPQASISSSGSNVTSNISFRPVGITLKIRPVLAGTETVILQVFANISAVTGFVDTEPVQTPVISSAEVVTSVHVANGKTTVIGGLTSRSTFDQTSQVPILGDIPILGWLFRSVSTVTTETTLGFHITPRILQGPRSYVGG